MISVWIRFASFVHVQFELCNTCTVICAWSLFIIQFQKHMAVFLLDDLRNELTEKVEDAPFNV